VVVTKTVTARTSIPPSSAVAVFLFQSGASVRIEIEAGRWLRLM
jgi:hypothetical protein